MKRDMIRGIYILAIGALALVSCEREFHPESPASATLGVQVEVAPQTRSVVTGTVFSNGSLLNIILLDAGATNMYPDAVQPYMFSKKSDTDPGMWIPTQPQGLIIGIEPANVYAHYPAVLPTGEATLAADKLNIDVTLPDSRDFGSISGSGFESFYMTLKAGTNPTEIFTCRSEIDLMTGTGTQVSATAGGSKVTTINMKHALAMVIVYVKKSPHLTTTPAVSEITIQNSGANTPLVQGSFELASNNFTPNTTPAKYTRTMSGFPIDMAYYAMLAYPATMAEGESEMVLVDDNATYTIPMPAKTWASGKVYIYNVEISPNTAQISGVTLADWPEWKDESFDLD